MIFGEKNEIKVCVNQQIKYIKSLTVMISFVLLICVMISFALYLLIIHHKCKHLIFFLHNLLFIFHLVSSCGVEQKKKKLRKHCAFQK